MKNKYLHIIFFFCLVTVFVRPAKAFSPTLVVLANPEVAIASGVLLAAGVGYLYLTDPQAGSAVIDGAGNYVRKVVNTAKITALTLDMINQGITTAQDVYVEKANSWVSTQFQGFKDYINASPLLYPDLTETITVYDYNSNPDSIAVSNLPPGTIMVRSNGSFLTIGSMFKHTHAATRSNPLSNTCLLYDTEVVCEYSIGDSYPIIWDIYHYNATLSEVGNTIPASGVSVLDGISIDNPPASEHLPLLDVAFSDYSSSSAAPFSAVAGSDPVNSSSPGAITQADIDSWVTANQAELDNYSSSTCTAQLNSCGVFCQGSIATFGCDDSSGTPIVNPACSCQSGVVTPFVPSLPSNTTTSTAPAVGSTDSDILSGVQGNTNAINNNLVAGFGDMTTAVTTTAATSDNLAVTNTASIVDAIKDVEIAVKSDELTPPMLPPAATFDTNIVQPSDTDLQPILNSFSIPANLSDLFVNQVTISGADPVISMLIYGGQVDVDFSEYETWIDWAGHMIYFVSCVSALFLAFKK